MNKQVHIQVHVESNLKSPLQKTIFFSKKSEINVLAYKTKQQSFRLLYLFNFRTFAPLNHTNSK